jgi:hypothetical protein
VNQRRLAHILHRDCLVFGLSTPARHGRRQIPTSSRKFDVDDPEPRINGDEHENGSVSDSEYASPKKKKFAKTRPAVSAGSRKTKGNAVRESSGSDHPPQSSGKSKNVQRQR